MAEAARTNRKVGATEVCGPHALGWSLYCAVCQVRRASCRLQSRKPGFDPRPIHVTFVVDTVALWKVSVPVFPCQYHSTNAPYTSIHLPPTVYNVSLRALQFFPVSTIPPMLHTHSFIYHPHYIMYLSKHFSFPLSVPFHQSFELIFVLTLLLQEGQAGEARVPSNTAVRICP